MEKIMKLIIPGKQCLIWLMFHSRCLYLKNCWYMQLKTTKVVLLLLLLQHILEIPSLGADESFKSNILRQQVNVSLCLHKGWFHLIMNRQWHSWMCTYPEKQSTTLWSICLVVNVLCKHRKLDKLKMLYWSHKSRNSNSVIKTAWLEVCKPIKKALLC